MKWLYKYADERLRKNYMELKVRHRKCELAMIDLLTSKLGNYVRAADYVADYRPKVEQPGEEFIPKP